MCVDLVTPLPFKCVWPWWPPHPPCPPPFRCVWPWCPPTPLLQVRVGLVTRNTRSSVAAFYDLLGGWQAGEALFDPTLTREFCYVKPDRRLLLHIAQVCVWGGVGVGTAAASVAAAAAAHSAGGCCCSYTVIGYHFILVLCYWVIYSN